MLLAEPITEETRWARHFASPQGRRAWPCEALVRAISKQDFSTILEAGCGDGANLRLLAEHAARLVCVDACVEALELAESSALNSGVIKARLALLLGDIRHLEKIPALKSPVDAIVDVMAGQHVRWSEHGPLYAGYRKALTTGGWLFLYHLASGTSTDKAKQDGASGYESLPMLFPEAGYVALPSREEFRTCIINAGFAIKSHERVSRDYGDGRVAVYHALEAVAR